MRPPRIASREDAVDATQIEEWLSFYYDISLLAADCINDLGATQKVKSRLFQGHVATRVGFNVPRSMISNNKTDIENFTKDNECIIKSLSAINYGLFDENGKYERCATTQTHIVFKEDISKYDDDVFLHCPLMLQEYVKKIFEYRIIIVGDEYIAFRISSQNRNSTKVDWRIGASLFEMEEKCSMHEEIICKLKKFMNYIGLYYGIFDIVEDRSGRFWFLECNGDGQWYWLDKRFGGCISDLFARKFLELLT